MVVEGLNYDVMTVEGLNGAPLTENHLLKMSTDPKSNLPSTFTSMETSKSCVVSSQIKYICLFSATMILSLPLVPIFFKEFRSSRIVSSIIPLLCSNHSFLSCCHRFSSNFFLKKRDKISYWAHMCFEHIYIWFAQRTSRIISSFKYIYYLELVG